MITISGLNISQVKMLDEMWALESMEDMAEWYEQLPKSKRKMADLLQDMLVLASIDEDLEDLTDARKVLANF